MTPPPDAQDEINRLHDIVVEEVSLVDHAANKQRFLIVKRSEEMTTENDSSDLNEEDEELDGNEDGAAEEDKTTGASDDKPAEGKDGAVLTLTVEALEGLTELVERLSSGSDEDAKPQIAELAAELGKMSVQLATMAGVANDNNAPAKSAPETEGQSSGEATSKTIEAVRAMLQQAGNLLRAQTGTTEAKPSGGDKDTGEPQKALTGELRKLVATVKEQQKRLARLEKRFGLPNSRPAGEKRATKGEEDEEGWPLDMNRSFDRENVDKKLSFHDV